MSSDKKSNRFVIALRALFGTQSFEELNEEDKKAIEELNNNSKKNIESIEKAMLSDKAKQHSQLTNNLKVSGDAELELKGKKNEKNVKGKDKETELEK